MRAQKVLEVKRIQVRGVLWTLLVGLVTGCSAAGGPGPDYFVAPDRLTDGLDDIVLGDAGTQSDAADGTAVEAMFVHAPREMTENVRQPTSETMFERASEMDD